MAEPERQVYPPYKTGEDGERLPDATVKIGIKRWESTRHEWPYRNRQRELLRPPAQLRVRVLTGSPLAREQPLELAYDVPLSLCAGTYARDRSLSAK